MTKIEKSPYMPFYGKDAYDDEKFASLSYGAQGFFWRLAWWQWSEGSIPAQIDVIISLRGKEKESRRLWAEVAPMFPSSNGGERRQNAYVEQLRAKLVSVRAKRQQAAYKRHANADFCTPNSVFLHTLPHEEEKEDANVKDVQSICDEFISRPEPHPSELLVAIWLRKVSVTSLREILNRYPDKNAAYIDRCVETSVRERAKTRTAMSVGGVPNDAVAELRVMIDGYIFEHGTPPKDAGSCAGWDAGFTARFGFSRAALAGSTGEQCAAWLSKLKGTA